MKDKRIRNGIRWTPQAEYCYFRGCRCEGCKIAKILETKCLMKQTVFNIVEKIGTPEIRKEVEE